MIIKKNVVLLYVCCICVYTAGVCSGHQVSMIPQTYSLESDPKGCLLHDFIYDTLEKQNLLDSQQINRTHSQEAGADLTKRGNRILGGGRVLI